MKEIHDYPFVLKREEAADLLGVCVRTIDAMVRENTIPYFRANRVLRFRRDDILAQFKNGPRANNGGCI
jgi:excisionase family DNA binding protein